MLPKGEISLGIWGITFSKLFNTFCFIYFFFPFWDNLNMVIMVDFFWMACFWMLFQIYDHVATFMMSLISIYPCLHLSLCFPFFMMNV